MLSEARERLSSGGMEAVDLRLGEMSHLPVSDGEAGCVILDMVLHHAADPLAVLREAFRVLRPGGSLVLADLYRHEHEWVRDQMADQWLGFEEQDLEKWLQEAGFDRARFVEVPRQEDEYGVIMLQAARPGM